MMPLCFLFKEIKEVNVYDCDLTNDIVGGSLLAVNVTSAKGSLRGAGVVAATAEASEEDDEEDSAPKKLEKSTCSNVKEALAYSAMTCTELFGKESSILKTCKDECDGSKGALFGSVCMSNFATIQGDTKGVEINKKKRCFAGALRLGVHVQLCHHSGGHEG